MVLDHPGQGAQVLHACLIVGHRVCQIGLPLQGEGRVQVILGRIVVGGEWRVHRSGSGVFARRRGRAGAVAGDEVVQVPATVQG